MAQVEHEVAIVHRQYEPIFLQPASLRLHKKLFLLHDSDEEDQSGLHQLQGKPLLLVLFILIGVFAHQFLELAKEFVFAIVSVYLHFIEIINIGVHDYFYVQLVFVLAYKRQIDRIFILFELPWWALLAISQRWPPIYQ